MSGDHVTSTTLVAVLKFETDILDRVIYKNRSQHRRGVYFRVLQQVYKQLRFLLNPTNKLSDLATHVLDCSDVNLSKLDNEVQRNLGSTAADVLNRVLTLAILCRRMLATVYKCAQYVLGVLQRGFFLPFAMSCFAILSRVHGTTKLLLQTFSSLFRECVSSEADLMSDLAFTESECQWLIEFRMDTVSIPNLTPDQHAVRSDSDSKAPQTAALAEESSDSEIDADVDPKSTHKSVPATQTAAISPQTQATTKLHSQNPSSRKQPLDPAKHDAPSNERTSGKRPKRPLVQRPRPVSTADDVPSDTDSSSASEAMVRPRSAINQPHVVKAPATPQPSKGDPTSSKHRKRRRSKLLPADNNLSSIMQSNSLDGIFSVAPKKAKKAVKPARSKAHPKQGTGQPPTVKNQLTGRKAATKKKSKGARRSEGRKNRNTASKADDLDSIFSGLM